MSVPCYETGGKKTVRSLSLLRARPRVARLDVLPFFAAYVVPVAVFFASAPPVEEDGVPDSALRFRQTMLRTHGAHGAACCPCPIFSRAALVHGVQGARRLHARAAY